jgi:hypothetical protein
MTEQHVGETPPAPDEGHTERPETGQAPPVLPDARSLVMTCLTLLATKAWEAMGLVPNPETKTIERNLADAQIAIDAASALAGVVTPQLEERGRREIETLLANLRINFVEQKGKSP